MSTIIRPQFVHDLIGRKVILKLKWGQEYIGYLAAVDAFMNIQLVFAKENHHGAGYLGEMVIGCNNVLYIAEVDVLS